MANTPKKSQPDTKTAAQKVNKLVEEAVNNVYLDRSLTYQLLEDLRNRDMKPGIEWANVVAAKYIETLQRSNEQLVKIASMIAKKTDFENEEEVTDEDIDGILEENTREMSKIASGSKKKAIEETSDNG